MVTCYVQCILGNVDGFRPVKTSSVYVRVDRHAGAGGSRPFTTLRVLSVCACACARAVCVCVRIVKGFQPFLVPSSCCLSLGKE